MKLYRLKDHLHIVVHDSLAEIDATQWNAMLPDNNPFMRHEFLSGLEQTRCVCDTTGWQPAHIAVYADSSQSLLLGAMPCYIKNHSYGEYIFDWAWADAHHRHGLDYYPKLSNAIPFTPASGPRWLISEQADPQVTFDTLIETALALVSERDLSSFHSLFTTQDQVAALVDKGFSARHTTQFHWQNRDHKDRKYQSFDDFLARMSSKKRKNIRRERRRVQESGIRYRWLSGDDLDQASVGHMARFYARTIAAYGAQPYLNKAFFQHLADHFKQQTLFLFAYHQDQIIAGGLYFRSDDTLYGRYWGALDNFHSVHFETCYYQAIEWCIRHGYRRFEAGAQGEHKLARGLEPATTYSAHWIRDPQFRDAIDNFLKQEQNHTDHYARALLSHSPFKVEI